MADSVPHLDTQDVTYSEELGSGSYGKVWSCTYKQPQRVAVKTAHSGDSLAAVALWRECDVLARMGPHPNIVEVHAVCSPQKGSATAMAISHCDGPDLAALIPELYAAREARPRGDPRSTVMLDAPCFLDIMAGVLSALLHAHRSGFVHADIKCDNVMLRRKDASSVVVIDWGLAHPIGGAMRPMVGAPGYMPPEVVALQHAECPDATLTVHPSIDMYSAGILACQLLLGVSLDELHAFINGGTLEGALEAVCDCMFSAWQAEAVVRVLCASLDCDPAQRPWAAETLHAFMIASIEFKAHAVDRVLADAAADGEAAAAAEQPSVFDLIDYHRRVASASALVTAAPDDCDVEAVQQRIAELEAQRRQLQEAPGGAGAKRRRQRAACAKQRRAIDAELEHLQARVLRAAAAVQVPGLPQVRVSRDVAPEVPVAGGGALRTEGMGATPAVDDAWRVSSALASSGGAGESACLSLSRARPMWVLGSPEAGAQQGSGGAQLSEAKAGQGEPGRAACDAVARV